MIVTVPPTYPPGCKIVIVGEAPGREEEQWSICRRCGNEQEGQGQCRSCHQALTEPIPQGWVGQAGRCLQRACKVAGLDWSTIGRSNVAKRRPFRDSNDFEAAFYETIEEPVYTKTGKLAKRGKKITRKTAELVEYEGELADELRRHNPRLIVAAGNHALEAITGLVGITNYRGSVVSSRWTRSDGTPFKVLAVEHPSYILRGNLTNFWMLAHDLKKAKREAESPVISRLPWESVSDPEKDFDSVIQNIGYVARNPGTKWVLDVETRAGTLACFGISYRKGDGSLFAFCVPIQTTVEAYWSPEEECQIWEALNEAARANPFLCNQNIEYDIYYLLRYGVEPSGVYMDTMLAHSLLYPEFPKGLDFLCSWYLDDVVYYKSEGRNWSAGDRDEDLWAYNCLAPGTQVLTSDLAYVPIESLKVGDTLVSIDEQLPNNRHTRRKMRKSTVLATWHARKPCYKIAFTDGTSVIASSEHPWLQNRTRTSWRKTEDLRPGDKIAQLGPVWSPLQDFESGWLSGMYDGEGCVTKHSVQLAQKPGPVFDRVVSSLKHYGFTHVNLSSPATKRTTWRIATLTVRDGMRLLGSLRPMRLLANAEKLWNGRYPFQANQSREVASLVFIGLHPVVGLTTDTGTFVAEGLFTHNCKDDAFTLRVVEQIDLELEKRRMWEMYHGQTLRHKIES